MKKEQKHKYIIPFVGLSIGKHLFEYDVQDSYFQNIAYSPIQKGDLKVTLELEKKETMFIAKFEAKGVVEKDCDRCNTPVSVSINNDLEIIYKFGLEESIDENLIVLHPESYEIDVTDPIYQLIIISIPNRIVHEEGECDKEMLSLLQKYTVNKEDSDDEGENEANDDNGDEESIWSILKNKN